MHFPRVLVLGATGQIGRILRICWADRGDLAGQTGPRWQARRAIAGESVDDAGLDWVICDPLRDSQALADAARGCDVILCLSGVTNARAATDPQADLADNTTLALAAIRAASQVGARVFLASSAAVYGNQPGLLDEGAVLKPANAYGAAKVDMEQRSAEMGAELGVPVTSLRIGNIAGVDAILGGWKPGFRLDRFGDGHSPRRSYIGVATLARVLGDLMCIPDLPGALNIAEPGLVEMGALLEAAGLDWTPQAAPDTAIAKVELDVRALHTLCPWLPEQGDAAQMVAEWRGL